jgi:tetratricopeptide (TPR) repeat protein
MRLDAAALAVALCLAAPTAEADVARAEEMFTRGDYAAALVEVERASVAERARAQFLTAELHRVHGRHAAALAVVTPLAQSPEPDVARQARICQAEFLRLVGKPGDARRLLEPLVKDKPDDRRARHQLLLALIDLGEVAAARQLSAQSMSEYDAGAINLDDADELFYLAETARHAGEYKLANDSYDAAIDARPTFTRAGVQWAYLFGQKYASDLAAQTLEEVLKIDPNLPDAHAAMASILMESSYDLRAISHHVAKALEVNPSHGRALLVRAALEIDQNQWQAASRTLDQVLAVNARDAEALALRAAIHWLRDDAAGYERVKKQVFALNPGFAEFFRIIARSAVREHRYVDAVAFEKEAVALAPDYHEAMAGVGLGYLRLGMETEGLDWLDRSWRGDKYNVRVYNTRNLYRDTIRREYGFSTTRSFRIRYHNAEQKLLARYLEPVVERAFASMVARYGFRPKTPVILELYANAEHYSVRTVGLPDLGALGVTFGQVVTAMSPSNGDVNWGMVVWHELAHVFHIQLSNSRVPRWFTEGLAEYETLIARPEWRRENDADLYRALVNGELPSVVDLNARFMVPDSGAVVVAYYLSAVTVEYLAQTFGFAKVVEALKRFARGQETPEVIPAITGLSIARFDEEFRAYLSKRLAAYQGSFQLPTVEEDVTSLEIAVAAKPRDAAVRARLALGHYGQGHAEPALAVAEEALALDPHEAVARYVKAEVLLRGGNSPGALALYQGLVREGHDSYDLRLRLAQLAQAAGDDAQFVSHLCAAKRLDPERSFPYSELADHYKRVGQLDRALAELEHYVLLEQMQLAPVKELTLTYARRSAWAKVRTYGELALYISPFDTEVLLALGKAHGELGDHRPALFSYDSALLAEPPLRRPALAHLGRARALWALGNRAEARAALTLALSTEPENAEALALRTTIK